MKRRKFSAEFKSKVAIEALKERLTAQQIASKYEVHPQQVAKWKREFISGASKVFEKGGSPAKSEEEEKMDELLRVIGRQKVEIDFLKKSYNPAETET